jgi:hypothetical protein
MKEIAAVIALLTVTGCATQKGNDRLAQHGADQIKMVAIQREARMQEKQAEAVSNKELFDSLARVCEANKEHCPAVTVALAVIGVQGADDEDDDAPIVTLQQQRNEALEYVRVLATPVSTLLAGVGVAAIQADVSKNASDNAARVQINDALQDSNIVQSVADLGVAAVGSGGMDVGGDYYAVQDDGVIDQSVTTTTTNTETNTTTTSGDTNSDAYNTSGDTIDDDSLNSSYITNLGAMEDGQIADIVLNGGAVDIYTAGGIVTVTDDNLCDLFPDLTACAP